MKITEKESKVIKKFEVDYENGIKCEYTTTNNKLTNFSFSSNTNCLTFVENIDDLKNNHWSKHFSLIKKNIFTIKKIKDFKDFDKLYYVGGSRDGMLKDKDDNFISSPILLDDIFFHCWAHIETKEKKCQKILDSLKKEYILESKIVEIPGYNQNENKKHHHTLNLLVKLSDELYNKFIGNETYLSDMIKLDIFNFLKNN